MIVDDDGDDIDFFCQAITVINPDGVCQIANDGEEALEILRNGTDVLPDIIFLDLNMPGMDGKMCLLELKKDAKFKNIPVIIYTTSSYQQDREEILTLGAAYFLTKANSFSKICKGITEAIERATSV